MLASRGRWPCLASQSVLSLPVGVENRTPQLPNAKSRPCAWFHKEVGQPAYREVGRAPFHVYLLMELRG